MSQLKIYKASAGAGKTFRLAVEYLKIALSFEWNYKHILAVTFTNKATNEMKQRVVEELHKLAIGRQTHYLEVLKTEMGLSEMEISNRATVCLKHILHDYSRFSISTIDSFFQRVIKAFNRELGINTSYQVDLGDSQILDEAVDELLLSIDDDPELKKWLMQFARDKIMEGGGWNLKKDILKLGQQIYNEKFKELNQSLYDKLNNKTFIREYRNQLKQIINRFEGKLKELGKAGIQIIENSGLSISDFKYGKSGAVNSFYKMLNAELTIGKRLENAIADVTELYKSTDKSLVAEIAFKLHPLLVEAVEFYEQELENYNTAKLIVNQLYTLGILVDLQNMVRKITREKGVVLLSESGTLLKRIIADSETPFVYEKTGVYYHHFMIDEFQDTSVQQWNNFKPLIGNSLAENNLDMLVGDVKQAIYRWRNGNWDLLASDVSKAFPANGAEEESLVNNWRSAGKIIRFNNRIFQLTPQVLQSHFNDELGSVDLHLKEQILNLYKESLQQVGKKSLENSGYVRMRFLEKAKKDEEGHEDIILEDLVTQIKQVQDRGGKANEIAVLVRKKEEAKIVADHLLAEKGKGENPYNFNVLSSESLYVRNASSVTFILALLSLLVDSDDKLALASANHQYYQEIVPRLKESGIQLEWNQFEKKEQLSLTFNKPFNPDIAGQFETIEVRENELYRFLKSDFFNQQLGTRNLQEVILKLCDIFSLFTMKEELAYLQAFIDQVGLYMQNQTADITSFLYWWEDEGQKKTISISEDINAIRIQTIHKAKGLEYNYVFIPFCDWQLDISPQHAPILWCKPTVEPFNSLELVPVRYSKSMAESFFVEDYFIEKMNNYIDNLNLLYVAFTRARFALYTWSVNSDKLLGMGDLLVKSIQMDDNFPDEEQLLVGSLASNYNKEKGLFEIGEMQVIDKELKTELVEAVYPDNFKFADFGNFLHLRNNHEHYFEETQNYGKRINEGRLIHEILAGIVTASDLDKAINELVFKGMLTSEELIAIKSQLDVLISDNEVKSWFDGTYRVVNERNILSKDKDMKRPDRIMISEDETIVVDYKSGETELDKYKWQVRKYMKELQECGFPEVQGFIWYTKFNKRVPVEF